MHYLSLIASIAFNGTSIVLLKAFAVQREASETNAAVGPQAQDRIRDHLKFVLHPLVLLSMACFAAAAFTWILALAGIELSVAYPSMSVIFVVTAFAGRLVFGEKISARRWIGITLVVAGVALLYAG